MWFAEGTGSANMPEPRVKRQVAEPMAIYAEEQWVEGSTRTQGND
jgi:hypothetical protein